MVLKYFSFNHKTYPGTRYTYLSELRVVIQTITRDEAALRKHTQENDKNCSKQK